MLQALGPVSEQCQDDTLTGLYALELNDDL